jgi:hypothetical protein
MNDIYFTKPGPYEISIRQIVDESMASRVDELKAMLMQLAQKVETMAVTVADIKAAVQDERTVEDSLVALVNAIGAELKANGPAAVQDVLNMIADNKAAMAAAVTANTPADASSGGTTTGSGSTTGTGGTSTSTGDTSGTATEQPASTPA